MQALICWFEHHPGTASWFQALGVIVSLVGAIIVASYQNRAQRKLTAQEHQRHATQRLKTFIALGDHAAGLLRDGDSHMGSENPEDPAFYIRSVFQEASFDAMARTFAAFPFLELPDANTLSTALSVNDRFIAASEQLTIAVNSWPDRPEAFAKALHILSDEHLPIIHSYLEELRGTLNE